jgi:phage-related protein
MKTLILIVVLLFACPVANVFGQKDQGAQEDGPVGIFQSRAEYNQFMGGAKRAAYGQDGSPELQSMIPMLNDIALDRPVGWSANKYGDTGSILGLLSNSSIRNDLEMVDDQYEELRSLSAEVQARAATQLRGLDFSDRENLIRQMRGIREQATSDLNTVLLPHQVERLQQIRMQSLLRRRSLVDILTSDPIKSDLEITDRQSDELRDFEKQVQQDLQKEIAKLQEKARGRLLSKLNPSQKKEVENMIGDAFEFSQSAKKPGSKGKGSDPRKKKGKRK